MKYYMCLVITVLLLTGCEKNIEEIDVTSGPAVDNPIVRIVPFVPGMVMDEFGEPISQAIVKVGTQTTESDRTGSFTLYDVEIRQNGEYLSVSKSGYLQAGINYDGSIEGLVIISLSEEEIGNSTLSSSGK